MLAFVHVKILTNKNAMWDKLCVSIEELWMKINNYYLQSLKLHFRSLYIGGRMRLARMCNYIKMQIYRFSWSWKSVPTDGHSQSYCRRALRGVKSTTSLQRPESHVWRHTLTTKAYPHKLGGFSTRAPPRRGTNEAPAGAFGLKDGLT